jgi:hypothetical protein
MEDSTPTAMETYNYKRQQAFRIKKAIMAWKAKKALEVVAANRRVMARMKYHKEQGLPWPPPPPTTSTKETSTKDKRTRTKKPEAPILKPMRAVSAPQPRTENAKAQLEKNLQGQTWRAHEMLKGLKIEALANATKAQTAATQSAAEVVQARMALANEYTAKGEEALRAKSEAAYRAEARAQSLNATASKFDGVEERMRSKLATKSRAVMEEAHAKQTRIDNELNISKWGGQIFSLGTKRAEDAWDKNLTTLFKIWKYIATIARSLETSINNISDKDIEAIANHLVTALNLIEKTSADNEYNANEIKKLIDKAQTIEFRAIASTRNKAGFKRTKKHKKKRRKTRNNRTNKFVARKH